MAYIAYVQCLHDHCGLQQRVSIVTSTWCVCVAVVILEVMRYTVDWK